MHLFRCPECGCEHDQPAEAAFVVAVICLDCALLNDIRSGQARSEAGAVAVAVAVAEMVAAA